MYTTNSTNAHCDSCHMTADALESILRRLTNLERGMYQPIRPALADIAADVLNLHPSSPPDAVPPTSTTGTSSIAPAGPDVRRSSSNNSSPHEVQRTDLDRFLLPHLHHSSKVPAEDILKAIISEYQRAFPHTNCTKLNSRIKEWYRKRREYMTHRVYNYCNKNFRLRDGQEVLEMLRGNAQVLDEIREECKLDVTDAHAAREYAYDRVESFFNRRKPK